MVKKQCSVNLYFQKQNLPNKTKKITQMQKTKFPSTAQFWLHFLFFSSIVSLSALEIRFLLVPNPFNTLTIFATPKTFSSI